MTDDQTHRPLSGAWRAVWRWHFYAGLLVLPFLMLTTVAAMLAALLNAERRFAMAALAHNAHA